jgi:5-formyltetrahydrofolate cyclo-ligase
MSPRAELRRAMRAARAAYVRALTPAERADAARAAADLLAVHVPPGATVASYAAMGDELDTGRSTRCWRGAAARSPFRAWPPTAR